MSDRIGLVIIRAWVEAESPEPLRAQIRVSTDISAGIERTVTLCRAEEVSATIRAWLNDIVSQAEH